MSAGLAGPSLPPDDAGEESWGSFSWSGVPAWRPWLCRETATHQVALLEQNRAPRQSNPSCSMGLLFGVSPAPPWAGQDQGIPRGRPSQPYWELPPGLSSSRKARDDRQRGIRVVFQALGMALRGSWGHWGVTAGTSSPQYGKACLGDSQPARWPRGIGGGSRALTQPLLSPPQMTSPPGSTGSCTSSSTPPRASSSLPVSAGAHPCSEGSACSEELGSSTWPRSARSGSPGAGGDVLWVLSGICSPRSVLHAGGGLLRLLCQQSQDQGFPGHHRATVE